MSTFVGSKDTKAIKVGTKDVSAVYVGAQQIWPDGPGMLPPVLEMTFKSLEEAAVVPLTTANSYARGGGGAGGFKQVMNIPIVPGQGYSIKVGGGGSGTNGGSQSLDNYNQGVFLYFLVAGRRSQQISLAPTGICYIKIMAAQAVEEKQRQQGLCGGRFPGPFGKNGGEGASFTCGSGGGAGAKPNAAQEGVPAQEAALVFNADLDSRSWRRRGGKPE